MFAGSSANRWDSKLFLGWEKSPEVTFGFSHGKPNAPIPKHTNEPITYEGDRHLMTVAPTRSGKSRGLVIPNLLTYSGPVVVFDPKGELYRVTARRRREMGQKIICLDPFREIGPTSDGLNPLDIFKLPNADIECDAQTVAEWLSLGNKGVKDPFWDLSGAGLHSGLIAYAGMLEADQQHLGTCFDILMSDDASYNIAVLLDTLGKKMLPFAKAELAAFLQMPERETRPSVLATANSYIKPLIPAKVRETFTKSTFDINEIINGDPVSVYVIIPPDKLTSHRAILKMWLGALLKAVVARRELPENRTVFFLDECGQLGNFQFLETVITLCAGYGLTCWTFWQDLDQIAAVYPTTWRTIINNCGILQTFGLSNRQSAANWSAYLRADSETLLGMEPEDQLVQINGRKEIHCRRADYLNDKLYEGLFDDNPMHAKKKKTEDTGGGRGI